MITAFNENDEVVIARDVDKNQEYKCRVCLENVILKKGEIKIHHFAHKAHSDCSAGNETIHHMNAKLMIYDLLRSKKAKMEVTIGDRRADVVAQDLVIEVQHSAISLSEIRERERDYKKNGYRVTWVVCRSLATYELRLTAWQVYLIKKGHNTVYDESTGKLLKIQIENVQREVESTDWGGGYSKTLKSTFTFSVLRYVN